MNSIECSVGGLVYSYLMGYLSLGAIFCYRDGSVKGIHPYFAP